jgi:hypothetical protein
MSLIAVASAKGSPGVTTTALVLGALWPREVLVAECDASGSDIPVRMPAADGGVLDPDRGLLSLAAAGRKGLTPDLVLGHTQEITGGLEVLAGVRMPEQAAGMTNVWPVLGQTLDAIPDYDVLADCGRIGATTPQSAILRASRLLIMVTSAEPSSVVHLRERLTVLADQLDSSSPTGTPIAVAVIAPPRARETVDQVWEALQRAEVPLHRVWHLAQDPKGAGFFRGHVVGRPDRTPLVRSARAIAEDAAAIVAPFFQESAQEIADEPSGDEVPAREARPGRQAALSPNVATQSAPSRPQGDDSPTQPIARDAARGANR